MNIQRGLVKDLGYEDTECTYVTGVDGVQYYFVQGTTLTDGLYVATPNVKEAVGHESYSTLGVIDENTNVIIPCNNKRIELVADRFLLVEKNEVEGIDVKASLAVKDDPTQASAYNNDSLNIKRAMENQMGSEGVFIFDDMFSEANLYDFTGKKILGDDSTGFSFIGQVGNDLYLHTINIHDSIKVIKTPVTNEEEPAEPIAPAPDVIAPTTLQTDVSEEESTSSPVVSDNFNIPTPQPVVSDDLSGMGNNSFGTDNLGVNDNADVSIPTDVTPTAVPNPDINPTPVVPTEPVVSDTLPTEVSQTEEISAIDKYLDPEDEKEDSVASVQEVPSIVPTSHEKPGVKNAVYDEAVEAIKNLVDKNKRLENDIESKGVRIKELEIDNKDFAKTIKNQKELIEKLENEKQEHLLEIKQNRKNIETLEAEKKEFLKTIESQRIRIEEQESKLKAQDEQLTQHESGKEELVRLLENVGEVLD